MAIIIKRQSVECYDEEILAEVKQIITGGNMQMVRHEDLVFISGVEFQKRCSFNISVQCELFSATRYFVRHLIKSLGYFQTSV